MLCICYNWLILLFSLSDAQSSIGGRKCLPPDKRRAQNDAPSIEHCLRSKALILVTGGAGFIGANFVIDWIATVGTPVVNLDKLTYAGNLGNLASLRSDARHIF